MSFSDPLSARLTAMDRLRLFLRPPGRGIHTHSTGAPYASTVLKALYGTDSPKEVQSCWEDSLQRIRRVEAILLGIPSDTGAGLLRGANFGPIGVREAFLGHFPGYPKSVLDVGDVVCVPQLLHDEMLSTEQRDATRRELYPGGEGEEGLAVSPLSIAEQALQAILELNRDARILVLGGDHSVSWPVMQYCHRRFGLDWGVVHLDAHTDLLEQRMGIRYCYTTWAHHALKLMNPYNFVQVGIRSSLRPKEYWMQKYPILQIWANEVRDQEAEAVHRILQHFAERKVKKVYISNDIDGTGTAAQADGLRPEFIEALIGALKSEMDVIGGDVVEVAPPLTRGDFKSEPTCCLGAHYLRQLFPTAGNA